MSNLTLPITIGKQYVNRAGSIVTAESPKGVFSVRPDIAHVSSSENSGAAYVWLNDGTVRMPGSLHPHDLVADYVQPVDSADLRAQLLFAHLQQQNTLFDAPERQAWLTNQDFDAPHYLAALGRNLRNASAGPLWVANLGNMQTAPEVARQAAGRFRLPKKENMSNDQSIDQEIQAKGKTAPHPDGMPLMKKKDHNENIYRFTRGQGCLPTDVPSMAHAPVQQDAGASMTIRSLIWCAVAVVAIIAAAGLLR